MSNQLITFEGNKVNLPPNFEWKIFSIFTPRKIIFDQSNHFNDFDKCIHKGQVSGGMHLFELITDEITLMAYCHIVEKSQILTAK